jgi:hypothetical protein
MNTPTGETNMENLPASAVRLEAKASQHGWRTSWNVVDGEWKGQPVHSVLLKLHKGNVRLACTWENGAFKVALRKRPFGRLNSRQVAELVTS